MITSCFRNLNERKAYFLGFLLADGCLNGKQVRVELQRRDEYILHQFRKLLNSDVKIYRRVRESDGRQYSLLCVYAPRFVSYLKSLGFTENKWSSIEVPDIPDKLKSHFWRGVVDGDGSLFMSGVRSGKGRRCNLELSGNKQVCESFANFLRGAGVRHNRRVLEVFQKGHHTQPHHVFRLNGSLARQAVKVLYASSNIHLARKYEVALKFMNWKSRGISLSGRKRISDAKKLFWRDPINKRSASESMRKAWVLRRSSL